MELRDYQWEVIEPALDGQNIIIWLPTGAGKTRAAAYVCLRHLANREKAKVAVLVNKVHLVDQHLKKEFSVLQGRFQVAAISRDSQQKCFFSQAVESNDLIICTAQILQNALESQEEEMHIELTDFSLLVIDECHHTHKDAVYNKIMGRYLEHKLTGKRNLPQILGLTASPGTEGAGTLDGAKEHILQICANLDTDRIMSSEKHRSYLEVQIPQPVKRYNVCQERPQDPFGRKLKEAMAQIHEYLNVPGLSQDFGTQIYEQRIVELEKEGAEGLCRKTRTCALHLRKYNDALLINDTVRMIDAFDFLEAFYQKEKEKKLLREPTERFLFRKFDEDKDILFVLAQDKQFENPKLSTLEVILRDQFQTAPERSRGIVFAKTRQCAHSLHKWVQENRALMVLGIKAAALTGAGYSNQTKHMTQNEQQDVIQMFRKGERNLLFSTSVAEEGLDIPECNIVVRYGLMTNEIAMMQARGRARAPDSVYSVVAKANSKEVAREHVNETLEVLMERAIRWVQQMPPQEYRLKIAELQKNAIVSRKLKEAKREGQRRLHAPDDVCLYCVDCSQAVCYGSDLRTVEGIHRVNINPNFRFYYKVLDPVELPCTFKDWKPGNIISCSNCGQHWGMEMVYREVTLPMISIKNFVVETPDGRKQHKQWSKVTFPIEAFDFVDYCRTNLSMDI